MNGAWFGLMTVARYIALSLISRYHCLDPTNRDISGLHCRNNLPIWYQVHSRQVPLQLNWHPSINKRHLTDLTYFCKSRNVPNGEMNEKIFSTPSPDQVHIMSPSCPNCNYQQSIEDTAVCLGWMSLDHLHHYLCYFTARWYSSVNLCCVEFNIPSSL